MRSDSDIATSEDCAGSVDAFGDHVGVTGCVFAHGAIDNLGLSGVGEHGQIADARFGIAADLDGCLAAHHRLLGGGVRQGPGSLLKTGIRAPFPAAYAGNPSGTRQVSRETAGVTRRDTPTGAISAAGGLTTVRAGLAGLEGDIAEVAAAAARDADVDARHLGEYVTGLIAACRARGRVDRSLSEAIRVEGEAAAESGIPLSALVDLYLSATWRLWEALAKRLEGAGMAEVASLATVVMRAADDTVAVLTDGYESAQRRAVRREEALRREFVDDLLSGSSDPDVLADRAARFGFNLPGAHVVLVARTHRLLEDAGPVHRRVEALVLSALGGRDVMVATKDGMLVGAFAPDADFVDALVRMLHESGEGPWRIGVGGAHSGPGGLLRSYREALKALELAGRAALTDPVAYFEELLPVRLLAADPAVSGALVRTVLGPLERARGGGAPLLETLAAYLGAAGNVEAAARALHLSSRAVRYRLDRITTLTGRSPSEPEDRFVLELALRCRAIGAPAPTGARGTDA